MYDMYDMIFIPSFCCGRLIVNTRLNAIPHLTWYGVMDSMFMLLKHVQQLTGEVVAQEVVAWLIGTQFVVEILLKELIIGIWYHRRWGKHGCV